MGPTPNPIPPNVVACIGGINGKTRSYNLWKDGQMIVIQAPPLLDENTPLEDLWCPPAEVVMKIETEYWFDLEHIHTLLSSIDFGKTNWAYLVRQNKGGYCIVQKQKSLYRVRAQTWAPRIEEKEITYTKWFTVDLRMGYWKGQEVDVILGTDDHTLSRVEDTMIGYRALQGLDLTYTVLAHVVQSDGSVIGVVTEPEAGRLVQFRDRALVYKAIARLQQRNLIYYGIHYSKIHILDGKVRLSNLASISYIKDAAKLNQVAESRHWGALDELFRSLDPDDEVPQLPLERIIMQTTLKLLPDHPSPERPRFMRFLLTTYLPEGLDDRSKFFGHERPNSRPRKRGVVSLLRLVSEETPEGDAAGVDDSPLSIQRARHHSRRESFHPYRQRPRRLLVSGSESESSGSSIADLLP